MEMFYLMMHSAHFILQSYGMKQMVENLKIGK